MAVCIFEKPLKCSACTAESKLQCLLNHITYQVSKEGEKILREELTHEIYQPRRNINRYI